MVQRSPDPQLVYLHCSSIFSGLNALVRKPKKVSQILSQHRSSTQILTKTFGLTEIAAVAKGLLDDGIFESQSRARLRFPELFQPSQAQEALRHLSQPEAATVEAEAVTESILTKNEESEEKLGHDRALTEDEPSGHTHHAQSLRLEDGEVPISTQPEHTIIPQLHPIYLPFRTQHLTLTYVQSILEKCCFEFGNVWVPDMMAAQGWEEAEAVELNRWVHLFAKYAGDLPDSAIGPVADQGVMPVLSAMTSLRHSAVHRYRTSAPETWNMLDAAVAFAEALKDDQRAATIQKIKSELSVVIQDIEEHQTLLERNLSVQLKDFARRRAEIDELERLAIEDTLTKDKKHRTTAGSAVENFLTDLRASQIRTSTESAGQEVDTTDPEPQRDANTVDEGDICSVADVYDRIEKDSCSEIAAEGQSLEREPYAEIVSPNTPQLAGAEENGYSFPKYGYSSPVNVSPPLSESSRSEGESYYSGGFWASRALSRKTAAAAASLSLEHTSTGDDVDYRAGEGCSPANEEEAPALEEAPEVDYNEKITAAESHPSHSSLAENAKFSTASTSPDEQFILKTPEITDEAELMEIPTSEDDVRPVDATAEIEHIYPTVPVEEQSKACPVEEPPCEHATTELLEQNADPHPPPPPLASAAPTLPPSLKDSPAGSQDAGSRMIVLRFTVQKSNIITWVRATTKTAILDEALAVFARCFPKDPPKKGRRERVYDRELRSVLVDGLEVDIRTYDCEDLGYLIDMVAKTGLPVISVYIDERWGF